MSEVDFDWFDANQSLVGGIKLLKKQKTSSLKTGKSGTYIDPKKGSTALPANSADLDEKYRQAVAVINSTTWLIEYSKYLKITDLEFEEMVKVVRENMELNNDFFELTNITIDTWEKIYYNAITVRGKNKLKHLYNMERQHVS
jgi:hypothetical protein